MRGTIAAIVWMSLWLLLWLALPVHAVVSISRLRRNRPGESCAFAYCVLLGWIQAMIVLGYVILRYGWYGEGASPAQLMMNQLIGAVIFFAVPALHVALFKVAKSPDVI